MGLRRLLPWAHVGWPQGRRNDAASERPGRTLAGVQERIGRMAQLPDDPSRTNGTAHASAPIHGSLSAPWHRGERGPASLPVHLLREVLRHCGPKQQARWCGQGAASGRPSIARIRACHDRNGSFMQRAANPRICWVRARRAVRNGRAGRLIGRCCWCGLHQQHFGGFDVHA